MRIYAVAVATNNEGYYDALIESCKRNEIELIVLGYGEKWQGFAWRFLLIKQFLETLVDNDVVICIDAYDLISTQHISVIKERFIEFNSPIVLSTEDVDDYSIQYYARKKIFGHCNKANVCGGAYMGYVYALKKLYSRICAGFDCSNPSFSTLDDQRILTHICKDDEFVKQYIQFDYHSSIFYTIKYPSNIIDMVNNVFQPDPEIHEIIDNRLYFKDTQTSPCFIHGNGNVNMDFLINLYNLEKPKVERKKYFLKTIQNYFKFLMVEVAIIIILILCICFLIYKKTK